MLFLFNDPRYNQPPSAHEAPGRGEARLSGPAHWGVPQVLFRATAAAAPSTAAPSDAIAPRATKARPAAGSEAADGDGAAGSPSPSSRFFQAMLRSSLLALEMHVMGWDGIALEMHVMGWDGIAPRSGDPAPGPALFCSSQADLARCIRTILLATVFASSAFEQRCTHSPTRTSCRTLRGEAVRQSLLPRLPGQYLQLSKLSKPTPQRRELG